MSDAKTKPRQRARNYLQAIHEAQWEEMTRDPRVIIMGEDLRRNLFGTSSGLLEEFGPERVRDLPLSENGFVGAAVGAAMTGLRPIVDITIASFMYCAMDQLVNQAAKNRYMFGGQADIPVVYRAAMFYSGAIGAHHADRPYPMFMGVPGLKIIAPSTPADMKGLLKAAIREDDPVLCFRRSGPLGRSVTASRRRSRREARQRRRQAGGRRRHRRGDLRRGEPGAEGGRHPGRRRNLGRGR